MKLNKLPSKIFSFSILAVLTACGGHSKPIAPLPSSTPQAAESARLPQLSGRWLVTRVDCLSNDAHLRTQLEIDLSQRFFSLIGTSRDDTNTQCRSVMAYQRAASNFSFTETLAQEQGVLSNGKSKEVCQPKAFSDGQPTTNIQDAPKLDITYSLSVQGQQLEVRLDGWPECKLLSLTASPKP